MSNSFGKLQYYLNLEGNSGLMTARPSKIAKACCEARFTNAWGGTAPKVELDITSETGRGTK